jgi:hypothetical protein
MAQALIQHKNMAHFAQLDSNNIVLTVLVVNNEVLLKEDNTESELKGIEFLNSLLGTSNWKQTSYNGNFRKNFAGVGYTYDSGRDAFVPPKPFDSWVLNEDTCLWEAPIEYPNTLNDEGIPDIYLWNEEKQEWVLID